jgi:superfamily I DNA and RNA helicase
VVCNEINVARSHFPYLSFEMPDLQKIELIQRDLSERQVRALQIRDEFLAKLRAAGYSEDEITDILSAEVKNGAA